MKIPGPTETFNTLSLLLLAAMAIGAVVLIAPMLDQPQRPEPRPEVIPTPAHLQELGATVAELTDAIAEAREAFEDIITEAEVSRCILNQGEWHEVYGCTLEVIE